MIVNLTRAACHRKEKLPYRQALHPHEVYWLRFTVNVTPLSLVSVTPEPTTKVVSAVSVNWTLVAGGPAGPVPVEPADPPHEVNDDMASTAKAQHTSVLQRLLRMPKTKKANTGVTVNGRFRNGAGCRRDSAVEVIVTTTGAV